MKFIIVASLLMKVVIATPEFQAYKDEYGKMYSTRAEERMRMTIFNDNLRKIKQHNSRPDITWKMGINQFTDMTGKILNRLN